MTLFTVNWKRTAALSLLVEESWRGGCELDLSQPSADTPTPNPSPQGGGGLAEFHS